MREPAEIEDQTAAGGRTALRRAEVRYRALQRVQQQIWQMRDPDDIDQVWQAIVDSLRELEIPFDHCGINVVREPGTEGATDRGTRTDAGLGIVEKFWHAGETVYRHNLEEKDVYRERTRIEEQFGRTVRAVIDVPFSHGTLALNSARIDPFSPWHIEVLEDFTRALSGGFRRMEDLVQLVVLVLGFAIAVPVALSSVGGLSAVLDTGSTAGQGYLNFWRGGSSGWTYVGLLVPAFIISPGLLQKVYGARDAGTVRWGVGLAAVVLMIFAVIPPLLGMIARVNHPELMNHELALPTVLVYELPVVLGSIGLAAIVSAEISSADAILFMLATSLSQDLYRRFLAPKASDAMVLKVSRMAAVGGGVLGVTLAITLSSVIDALTIFYALLGVSLFVPVLAGICTKKGGVPEAMASIAAGIAVLLFVHFHTGGSGYAALSPTLVGLCAASLSFFLVLIFRRSSPTISD